MNKFPSTDSLSVLIIGPRNRIEGTFECTVEYDFQEDGLPLSEHEVTLDETFLFFMVRNQGGPEKMQDIAEIVGKEFILTP